MINLDCNKIPSPFISQILIDDLLCIKNTNICYVHYVYSDFITYVVHVYVETKEWQGKL